MQLWIKEFGGDYAALNAEIHSVLNLVKNTLRIGQSSMIWKRCVPCFLILKLYNAWNKGKTNAGIHACMAWGCTSTFYCLLMIQVKASPHYTISFESEHETPRMSDGHYCSILRCGICWSESPISWFEVHAALKRGQHVQVNYRIHLWSWWRVEATADVHGRSTCKLERESFMDKARAEKSSCHKLILEAVECMLSRVPLKRRWKLLAGSCIV